MKNLHQLFLSALSTFLFLSSCDLVADIETFQQPAPSRIETESSGRIPLNDPNLFFYENSLSGLYTWGNELTSNSYSTKYINTCKKINLLDSLGLPSSKGKIVILGIGGSNPAIIFNGIIAAQLADRNFGENIVFINGGMSAMDLSDLLDPATNYWDRVNKLLDSAHVGIKQVQVMFCIEDNLRNKDTTFQRVNALKDDYTALLDIIRTQYPSCKLFFVGDRGYNGYTTVQQHREPIGYLNGWAVKLFIEEYTSQNLPRYPLVNWLDYYWADGQNPRWDGLTYYATDFKGSTYIHFTDEKGNELGSHTHEKLKIDPGAMYWYK